MRKDVQYALRQLRRSPGLSLAIVLTLALGIGANAAIFSVANGVMLRPLPYEHGDQLVHVGYRDTPLGPMEFLFSVQDFLDYRRQSETLAGLVEYHSLAFNLLGPGEPDRVRTGVVSADFFAEFGIRPLLGRTLQPGDESPGAPGVLLLSHSYWRRRYGGDPGVVGQTLRLNGTPVSVVGVLPPLPPFPAEDDVYVPTTVCPFRSGERMINDRGVRMLRLYGRRKPEASLERVQADLATIAGRLYQEHPDSHVGDPREAVSLIPVREELVKGFRPTLLVLVGTVALILLIACANVANLLLVRLLSREKEMVVRIALGAGRDRLLRQLLTESAVLALMGGVLGLLLALPAVDLLVAFVGRSTARAQEIRVNGAMLLFTLGLSLLTALGFGLIPALRWTRRDLASGLKEGGGPATVGGGRHRLQKLLVVAQVGLSFVLLVAAGLAIRSLAALQRVDAGFRPEDVVAVPIALPTAKYGTPQDVLGFYGRLLERVSSYPGVRSVAVVTDLPMDGNLILRRISIEGRQSEPGQEPQAEFHIASAGYFRTLGIPLLQGRTFDERDGAAAPLVVVVNRAMAERYWPGEDPVGKRIGGLGGVVDDWATIVGVVGDVKQIGLDVEVGPAYYLPFLQHAAPSLRLLAKTEADPVTLARDIRSTVREIDPEQPLGEVQTLAQLRSDSIASPRLRAVLLSLFAGLASAIAVVGLSGLIGHLIGQRRKEIGIRMAIGAERGRVLLLVLRDGLILALIGLALGLAGSLLLTRWTSRFLFGIEATDPLTFLAISLGFLAVVALACLLPARRASRIDPMVALR